MNAKNKINHIVLLILCMILSMGSAKAEAEQAALNAQQRQAQIFMNTLQLSATSYEAGGAEGLRSALLSNGCSAASEHLKPLAYLPDLPDSIFQPLPFKNNVKNFLNGKKEALKEKAFSNLCAAINGQDTPKMNFRAEVKNIVADNIIPFAIGSAQTQLNQTGLPFLKNLEIQLGARDGHLINSISTIHPIWEDALKQHHVFSQLSWYSASDETDSDGYRKFRDTMNIGLAYRYLTPDQKWLYGLNAFIDHAPQLDHNRASLGFDIRTSQAAVAFNRYFPLSGYKALDDYYEEKAAGGWDFELSGQTPELPSWTAAVKAYQWDSQENRKDVHGFVTSLEYSPVPALAVRMGVRDENQTTPSAEVALAFKWSFDQPKELQLRRREALLPVSDYVYEKVRRENVVRVQKRRRDIAKLSATYVSGTVTATETEQTYTITAGKTLLMPVTVQTAAGAEVRLATSEGGLITAGASTRLQVEPRLITVLSGSVTYTSDGVIQTVNTPNGTIVLNGTDIDVVVSGTDTSVRVRDGNVTFTGSISGTANLDAGEFGQSTSGAVTKFANNTAQYENHAVEIFEKIDSAVPKQTGIKVTPYIHEITLEDPQPVNEGDTLSVALKFNTPVTVSGGTPELTLRLNGNDDTSASYVSGSGTQKLVFNYATVAADAGASQVIVNDFTASGATISGNGGKNAITTFADTTLTLTTAIADTTNPSGYAVAFTSNPTFSNNVNEVNQGSVDIEITSAEVGTTYNYTIASDGGGTDVTGSGTVSDVTEAITALDLSSLADGTLTLSVTLTDANSNVGSAATTTVTLDTVDPTISSVTAPADNTYEPT